MPQDASGAAVASAPGEDLKHTLEAALLAAGRPLSVAALCELLAEPLDPIAPGEAGPGAPPAGAPRGPGPDAVRAALRALAEDYRGRGIELAEVASGFRVQVRAEYGPRVARLWAERPQRYSRALLETLALIAYRQPVSRAEIEEVRGVAVSSSIFKTLQEREWIRVVGHRETPGRPALYGTTRQFLDDFNLRRLSDLPPLAELLPEPGADAGELIEGLIGAVAALPLPGGEPGEGRDEHGGEGAAPGAGESGGAPAAAPLPGVTDGPRGA
jgi:segregation and condensation protein B